MFLEIHTNLKKATTDNIVLAKCGVKSGIENPTHLAAAIFPIPHFFIT